MSTHQDRCSAKQRNDRCEARMTVRVEAAKSFKGLDAAVSLIVDGLIRNALLVTLTAVFVPQKESAPRAIFRISKKFEQETSSFVKITP